jgi:hypothetical protein
MEYLRGRGSDFVFRLRSPAFTAYTAEGEKVELAGCFEGLGEGETVFPPMEIKTPAKEWSFWKELEISLVLVSMLILGALDMGKMMGNLHWLPVVCANSKRRRLPALWRFLSTA